jgi:crossover junction endodeoxyribonuclease RusA
MSTAGNKSAISFEIGTKAVLNSNRMPANVHVKSSMASKLRTMGQQAGLDGHFYPAFAQSTLDTALELAEMNTVKSRIRKRMRKSGGFTEAEIDIEVTKALEALDSVEDTVLTEDEKDYMFNRFVVIVEVFTPTRRRSDPPNLYPTVKALVDGLTDAGWWEDDDYSRMVQMSFRHGGLSNIKDTYKLILHIVEVDDHWVDTLLGGAEDGS